MSSRFDTAMRLMRRHDPQAREDGFSSMREIATDHVADLIREFQTEADQGLRCWLLELIGEARSSQAADLLINQLHGDDQSLRDWAIRGLENLGTPAARTALYQASANGLIPPRPGRR